jgi:hypothetical protein
VTWSGAHRAALVDQPVYPRPVQDPLPVWVAVGGNPQSVVRAGLLGLPLALAIIGGQPERFGPLAHLHRRALAEAGHDQQQPMSELASESSNTAPARSADRAQRGNALSLNVHGFVADTRERAADVYYPAHSGVMNRIGRERGWGPTNPPRSTPRPARAARTPSAIPRRSRRRSSLARALRAGAHADPGRDRRRAHREVLRAIELLGTKVAPLVQAGL